VYQADRVRKADRSWDDQLSAMTYNRFQYYSKLRTYAMDDSALVSSVLLYVPPGLTFINAKFYPRCVLMCSVYSDYFTTQL